MQKPNPDVDRLVRIAKIALNVLVVLLVSALLALVVGLVAQASGTPTPAALGVAGDSFVKIAGVLLGAVGLIYAVAPPKK